MQTALMNQRSFRLCLPNNRALSLAVILSVRLTKVERLVSSEVTIADRANN